MGQHHQRSEQLCPDPTPTRNPSRPFRPIQRTHHSHLSSPLAARSTPSMLHASGEQLSGLLHMNEPAEPITPMLDSAVHHQAPAPTCTIQQPAALHPLPRARSANDQCRWVENHLNTGHAPARSRRQRPIQHASIFIQPSPTRRQPSSHTHAPCRRLPTPTTKPTCNRTPSARASDRRRPRSSSARINDHDHKPMVTATHVPTIKNYSNDRQTNPS
ncbi:hypothetical protein ACLOJK_006954 [Asimina triloba]